MTGLFDLSAKVALVTGGNAGIGFGIAQGLAEAGCRVAVWGRDASANRKAVQRLTALGGIATSQVVDVTDEAAVDAAMTDEIVRFGRIDVVVAAAGVANTPTPFTDQTQGDWAAPIQTNVLGTAHPFRAGLRHMIERHKAGDGGGSLVAIASLSARTGAPGMQPYAASKAAVVSIVQGLAVEAGRYGVRANAILPGWTETALTREALRNARVSAMVAKRTPLRRWGKPEDYAALAVYLASDGSRFHTGDVMVVDGGFSLT